MKSSINFGLIALLFVTPSWAKSLQIENDTDSSVSTMIVQKQHQQLGDTGKKVFALDIASAPDRAKGPKAHGAPADIERSKKSIEVGDMQDSDCMNSITFTLGNGKIVRTPLLDLCNVETIVVEDVIE